MASAATVERRPGGTVDEEKVDIVRVKAAAGEANTLTVTVSRGGDYTVTTVRDETAPLTIVRGCTATDAQTVRCRGRDDLGQVDIELGDGDDAATVASESGERFYYLTTIDGGPGNDDLDADDGGGLTGGPGDDRLRGSRAYESLDGGPGNDELFGRGHGDYLEGGPGDDVLRGGPGSDTLIGGPFEDSSETAGSDQLFGEAGDDSLQDADTDAGVPEVGPDLLDGGDGKDTVGSYLRRASPVHVDLRESSGAGEAGENDSLQDVETVFGGEGDDSLIGDGGPNWLDGRDGNDAARGLGGDDLIFASDSDRVEGNGGGDDIRTVPQFGGTLSCDRGRDTVRIDVFLSQPARLAGPVIERACERLTDGSSFVIDPLPALGPNGGLSFRVVKFRSRRLRLTLSHAADSFGRIASQRIRSKRVTVQLPEWLERRLRERPVTLRARVGPLGAAPFVWRFQIG